MHEHGPDQLPGPVRGTAAWWKGMGAEPDPTRDGTTPSTSAGAAPDQTKKPARPIRVDLVARVRKEIAAGTYDTPEKWEAALDCLLDRFERDL